MDKIRSLLLGLLPGKHRAYVALGLRLFEYVDTPEERDAAAAYLLETIESNGYLSVAEWSRWGGMLEILGKPK